MPQIGPYTKKVIEYFKKPHNYGKIKNPDGLGTAGNPVCGDVMRLYIRMGRDRKGREIIKDIKFQTFGCVAAIATSSVITDLAKGKTLKEVMKIDREMIVKLLGGLPPIKIHCSVLAAGALSEAIYNYLKKKNREIPEKLEQNHQRIEKEKKEISKKYKEWMKIEQKMFE